MEDSVISNIKFIKRKLKLTIMVFFFWSKSWFNDHYITKINMQRRTLLDNNLDNKSHGLAKYNSNCQVKNVNPTFFSQIL